jgi:hypothetical protein
MNKHETATMLGYLAAAYPNAAITKETARVFHEVLQGLEHGMVMSACREIVRESTFFPSASEVLRSVARTQGLLSPSATTAWSDVLEQVKLHGMRTIPEFAHATTAAVVKSIGWRNICMSESQEVLRSNFLRMYEEMSKENDRKSLALVSTDPSNALEAQKALGT